MRRCKTCDLPLWFSWLVMGIKAQEKLAGSPNHTVIYVPSGQNGLPIVLTQDADANSKP